MAKEPKNQIQNDEAAKKAADVLDKDNADTRAAAASGTAGSDVVYVFANLQSGQLFLLPDGVKVVIEGMPVSRLKGVDGQSFAGGKYGVTKVYAAQWARVKKIYGKMKIFQSGLIFDAPSIERGKAMARERGGLRHGHEPVDPLSQRVKTMPKTED
ncbi:MAG: hypothetical protein LBH65_04640 [Desulfovibrio sp.]|jgi:hypothetical protein|nr:hypothetical protein [Desulfovibrio sp.]